MPPRPIFLNRFYHPDPPATAQLLTDLAEGLAARGFAPLVITGRPDRADVPSNQLHNGVDIRRVNGTRWRETRLASKAVNFFTFYLAALWRLLRLARPGDVVVAMTDPPLLGIGVWLAARWRRARLVHWVQDIYPEIALALGAPRLLGLSRPLRNLAWRRADACVTLGTDMAAVLQAAGVPPARIHVLRNAAPAELRSQPWPGDAGLRSAWQLDGRFVVQYSGNLGRVHALEPVLLAAERLQADGRIAFVLVGTGAQAERLQEQVRQRGIRNVQFRPPQARAALSASLGIGDLHLVTLHPACAPYVFPSKLQGILTVGRPVLYIGPCASEVARMVTDNGLGLAFDPANVHGIAAAVRRLVDEPREYARLARRAAAFAATAGIVAAEEWCRLGTELGLPDPTPRAANPGVPA